ncbi:MAG TPA: aldehyde dehydrogenase (NADP(+)) [Gammaproteobacteria bacterium]
MPLSGELFIGASRVRTQASFRAVAPATGEPLEPPFASAGAAEVDRACRLAAAAFGAYRSLAPEQRARFLEAIADGIVALGDELIARAHAESALPVERLAGERGRTAGQLRLFADELRAGGWLGMRIDHALPERKPLPRPDLRQRRIPLGPVAVFGASNFPLAFSVAGGDTAAALAAGCPVVAKGHPAHPGTGELVAQAIARAAADCGMPDGVFSLLNGDANDVGAALVAHPAIRAVGFTGSRRGGLALMGIANARPEPIPVYAEMSSINPVLLLPGALAERAEAIAKGYVASVTLGVGQFCTNPGLVLGLAGPALDRFIAAASAAIAGVAPGVMLTAGIHAAYEAGVARLSAHERIRLLAAGGGPAGPGCGRAALFSVAGADLLADRSLMHEVFGAASLVVRCRDEDELAAVIGTLEGQLTATLHLADDDEALAARLLPLLELKAGRIIANGWPTGVEVSHAMVHGGPFPATSDGRSTSVGTLAIERFLRPVCYQDLPDALLPPELRADAPARPRRVDGAWRTG